MTLKNIKFDHIGFAVKDINKAIEWYGLILGFDILAPPGVCEMDLMGHKGYRCIVKNANNDCLEFEQRTDKPYPDNQSAIISHFSLNVANLEEMRTHLVKNNVDLDDEGKISEKPDKRILYMTGLDGIRIELIENK